jgi:ribosomal protein S18 acetylase RimI-like enzyme
MLIRPFAPNDTDAVIALWEACGLTRPWNDPREDIARKLRVQPELFLVGEADAGEPEPGILASAMAGYDGHRGWLYYFAVAPDRQGQGLGRSMLTEVEQRLLRLGCPKLQFQVRPENTAVLGFYRALGYEPYDSVSAGKRLVEDRAE